LHVITAVINLCNYILKPVFVCVCVMAAVSADVCYHQVMQWRLNTPTQSRMWSRRAFEITLCPYTHSSPFIVKHGDKHCVFIAVASQHLSCSQSFRSSCRFITSATLNYKSTFPCIMGR